MRFEHLTAIATKAGLAYVELSQTPDLMAAVSRHAHAKAIAVEADLRPFTSGMALLCLIAAYAWPRPNSGAARRATA